MSASRLEGWRAQRIDINKIPYAELRLYTRDQLIKAIHLLIKDAGESNQSLQEVLEMLRNCSPRVKIQASVGRFDDKVYGCWICSIHGDIPTDSQE